GPPDVSRNISVYSNASQVELFLNGRSLGIKKRNINQFPACGLNWEVNFKEGNNQLRAVAINGENVTTATDQLEVNYSFRKAGKPEELALNYQLLENGNYLVTATAVDSEKSRCLDYEEKVYFQCLTGGKLLENLGTPTGSSVIAMANGKASIEVIPNKYSESLTVTVLNQSFKGSFIQVKLNNTP
ncbi:MAG: DUF4982 domain-containing protein, partial [Marinoscillum sp.]